MLLFLDILGTLAFAFTGAFRAVKHELDWLGVIVLATMTGVGGGMVRDLLLGQTPPLALRQPVYIGICILGAVLTPADPISMFVLAVPLYLLYELGVVLLRLFPASRVRGTATPGDAEHPAADTPEPGAAQAYALPGRGERQDEPPDE